MQLTHPGMKLYVLQEPQACTCDSLRANVVMDTGLFVRGEPGQDLRFPSLYTQDVYM